MSEEELLQGEDHDIECDLEAAESIFGEIEACANLPSVKSEKSKQSLEGEEECSEEEYGEISLLLVPEGESIFGEYEGAPEDEEKLGEEEEEIESVSEKISLDSEYLKKVLGTPLTFALLEIASRRPTDPIHYLGHYLVKWRWNGENKEKYEREVAMLTAERAAYAEKARETDRQEMLRRQQKEEAAALREKLESSFEDDEDSELVGEEQDEERE